MENKVKSCMNCAYRKGSFEWGYCMLSGYYCEIERQHPSSCGTNFENWQPRKDSWVEGIINFFFGKN